MNVFHHQTEILEIKASAFSNNLTLSLFQQTETIKRNPSSELSQQSSCDPVRRC